MAINSDPQAPIFNVADVGIVGDYKKVVPLLIEELQRRMEWGFGKDVGYGTAI